MDPRVARNRSNPRTNNNETNNNTNNTDDPCPPRIRRDWRRMSTTERNLYIQATIELKRQGRYDVLTRTHADNFNFPQAHGTSFFLPWHRTFTYVFECRTGIGRKTPGANINRLS
ncbi:MAG: hypothetical protein MHM6MM_004429 [Cercozoa sp. M6MM]